MITIKITDHSICMNGHAGRKSPDGIDRVCAAVSALTCNLINSLKDLTGDCQMVGNFWWIHGSWGLQISTGNTTV